MPVLAVIPARLGATRLVRKPLRLLAGLPLVVRVFQRVVSLGVADHVVVATDSVEVVTVCSSHGIPVELTSSEHPSGTDRVADVASRQAYLGFDVIVNVQGDEPFVSHAAITGAVAVVADGRAPIGTAAVIGADPDILNRPDVVKLVCDEYGRALYFSRAPIPFLRESCDANLQRPLVRQHVGLYAYTREALRQWVTWPPHPLELIERLEQLRPLAHGLNIGVADVSAVEGGIDTEADLAHANARWSTYYPSPTPPTTPLTLSREIT